MRFGTVLVAAVAISSVALADDQKSIDRLVRTHLTNLAKRAKDDQLGLMKDAIVMVYGSLDRGNGISVADARQTPAGTVAHELGKAEIGIDGEHGVAWFQVPYAVDITPKSNIPGDTSLLHTKERMGGVAVLGKDGWQVAAVMYARLIDDATLVRLSKEHNDALPSADPKLTGDKGLDGAVASWIKGGFATHAAADASLIASGTAQTEYQVGDAAKTLAKTWDGLRLRASTIDSRTYADGALGFARARVAMPAKGGGAVEMTLAVAAMWQEKEWRWVSVQFSSTHF